MRKAGPRPELRAALLAAAVFAGLTLAVFWDVLLRGGSLVPSLPGADLAHLFAAYRGFAASELRHGNLPLWNPYLFAGAPFFGGFQSGLLYPLNLPYLVLPLAKAVDVDFALHLFLSGLSMYLWARGRRLRWTAAVLCGTLWMFCGAHFLHVAAGHLCRLDSMAWLPLVFLAVDGLFETRGLRWSLVGAGAAGMMLLAGDAQGAFFTAVAAGLYSALRMAKARQRLRVAAGLVLIGAGAAALAAAQLWTGLEAALASVRGGGGVPWWFARLSPLPPLGFLTLLAPGFFGDMTGVRYWGPGYLWEACLFMSVTGLLLAAYGAAAGRERRRFSAATALVLLALALGSHTPLLHALYAHVPGFDCFRATAKFGVQASAFLVLLAGVGLDRLTRASRVDRRLAAA
ncbi:MAG: hypothetical protein KGL53_00845, partial [Elusimicrobia bacterium]|nr:hypothetical protein [Elusimicrobiota bacterium]